MQSAWLPEGINPVTHAVPHAGLTGHGSEPHLYGASVSGSPRSYTVTSWPAYVLSLGHGHVCGWQQNPILDAPCPKPTPALSLLHVPLPPELSLGISEHLPER